MTLINKIKNYCGVALLASAAATVTLNSCTEKIDESDLYTFTGEMMLDHFINNPEVFSSYLEVLGRVHTSRISSSTVRDLLSARGNYTCFAPTNEAIQLYLDSLCSIGQLTSNQLDQISDSVAEAIVFNSIIQHGESEAYSSAEFKEGTLGRANMNDRYISISFKPDADNNTRTYVNSNSMIIDSDIEVENGFIHTINKVLSPSNKSIAGLIEMADNTQLFSNLLLLTGWDVKVLDFIDEEWERKHNPNVEGSDGIAGEDYIASNSTWNGKYPDKRKIGYTFFVETDDVFASHNITDIQSLKEWVRANNSFDDETNTGHITSWDDDYKSDYNWLNQFVAYHILPESMRDKDMVVFANEGGRSRSEMQNRRFDHLCNVWEYWETIGVQRRSLKITAVKPGRTVYYMINRASKYNTKYSNNIMTENIGAMNPDLMGIEISFTNGSYPNNGENGWYYPIKDILIWRPEIPNQVLNERMRYDVASLFPELITNGIRQERDKVSNSEDGHWYFPTDYIKNVVAMSTTTKFIYLPNRQYKGSASEGGGEWLNYQTDEFNIQGSFDFTMKLPPVPYTGTYEIRYGVNANDNRGMAQVYIGTNPNNLPAVGIPLDLRKASGAQPVNTGWIAESSLTDEQAVQDNTKAMRNLGYMKGPKYMSFGDATHTGRTSQICLRKIIYTGTLEAGKTYYIRFKDVLGNESAQFFFDYLEFVPKTVYASDIPEDVW